MRTTIDLDDSLLQRLRHAANAQNLSFRSLLHRVIQRGLAADAPDENAYKTPSLPLGQVREGVDLVHALRLATALGDEETGAELTRRR